MINSFQHMSVSGTKGLAAFHSGVCGQHVGEAWLHIKVVENCCRAA